MSSTANFTSMSHPVLFKWKPLQPAAVMLAIAGISTPATVGASSLYFFVRAANIVVYAIGVSFIRTVLFLAGFVTQMTVADTLLGSIS